MLRKPNADGLPQGKGGELIEDLLETYRVRLDELYAQKREITYQLEKLGKKRDALIAEQTRLMREQKEVFKVVYISVENPKTEKIHVQLDYFTENASWIPSYNLRIPEDGSPVQLEYIAKVSQTTGEDWTMVNITLSTEEPAWYLHMPQVRPFYLGQAKRTHQTQKFTSRNVGISGRVSEFKNGQPIPAANVVVRENGKVITGTTTDMEGFYQINGLPRGYYSIEASFIGFGSKIVSDIRFNMAPVNLDFELIEEAELLGEVEVIEYVVPMIDADKQGTTYTSTDFGYYGGGGSYSPKATRTKAESRLQNFDTEIRNETYVFTLEKPFSLASTDRRFRLTYAIKPLESKVVYVAAPGMEEKTYRNIEVENWEKLNLSPGELSIYSGKTFSGLTDLSLDDAMDTLKIATGIASEIVVRREKLLDYSEKRFLKSRIKTTTGYVIRVSNTASTSREVTVIDQVPVARRSQDEVELLESTGASFDERTGILTWKLSFDPGETKELTFKYAVQIER